MSDEKNGLGPQKGETADQFKSRILETQRELARAQAQAPKPDAASAAIAQGEPAAPPAPAQVTPPVVPPVVPEPESRQGVVTGKPEVDEWLSKKGFKTTEDIANSLREMERELHRRAAEAKANAPVVQAPPAPLPMYPPYTTAPMYAPPPPAPYAPTQPVDVERLAARYGLSVDDFEKIAAIANDLAESKIESKMRFALPPLVNQVQSLNKETSRNREMVDLMSDPTFRNPQVQYEMHRVLEEQPALFDTASPYRTAYQQALSRIGRASIGNPVPVAPVPAAGAPAAKPPTTAGGNGGGGGGVPSGDAPQVITDKVFAGMKLEDKKAYLRQVGAIG